MPAVLVEVGFIDSDIDNQLFDEKFGEVVLALANGITNVLEEEEGRYQVQVGLFRNKAYADTLLKELLQNRYPAYIEYDDRGYYAVKVGSYDNMEEAILMEQKLKQEGYATILVTS